MLFLLDVAAVTAVELVIARVSSEVQRSVVDLVATIAQHDDETLRTEAVFVLILLRLLRVLVGSDDVAPATLSWRCHVRVAAVDGTVACLGLDQCGKPGFGRTMRAVLCVPQVLDAEASVPMVFCEKKNALESGMSKSK